MKTKTSIILLWFFSINVSADIASDSSFSGTDSRVLLDNIRPGLMSLDANYGYADHIGKTINMTGNIGNSSLTFSDYTQFSVSATVDSSGNVFLKGSCSTRNLTAFNYDHNTAINSDSAIVSNTASKTIMTMDTYTNTELLKLPPICEFRISPTGLSVSTKDKAAKVFYNGFAQWASRDKTVTTYSKNDRNNAVVTYQ